MKDTVMLCFRDLVTAPGDSIAQHKRLIDEYGYCWWGWWMKPIEDVPNELLLRIVRANTNGGSRMFLYDCGLYRLYSVKLTDVAISPTNSGTSSPGIEQTPEYYVHVKCRAWFKLVEIDLVLDSKEPEDMEKLRLIKYIDFPSWRREDTHDAFKGKNITSFEELDQMAVTLWHIEVPVNL